MGVPVHHSPPSSEDGAFALRLPDNWGPLWIPRKEESLLLDDVPAGTIDIKVQAPIDVVLMPHARARVACARKTEPGPDRAVVEQSPFRDIAIPPRLDLAHQPQLTVLVPQGDALEIACVRAGLEDRGWRLCAQPPTRSNGVSADSEEWSFLILPIPVCHAVVVQHIENRHVGPPQDESAAVSDVPQLYPGALAIGRRRGISRPNHLKIPQGYPVANDPYVDSVGSGCIGNAFHTHRKVVLAVVVRRVIHTSGLPVDPALCHVHCHDLVPRGVCRAEYAQRGATDQRAVILLEIGQRWH